MVRHPSAIISYSHDSREHEERVRALAKRLRDDGVDCEIDAYQVSPPEGWPAWMRRQVQERDFRIVVCTEAYARRFAGDETPGTGKGATWEGHLLRQILYEDGKNDRIIPVVFTRTDVEHIPLELKSATRYDLSSPEGYSDLHRALTNQPRIERGPLGPVRRHMPALPLALQNAVSLMAFCEDPIPLQVMAKVTQSVANEVRDGLGRLIDDGLAAIDAETISLLDRSITDVPTPSAQTLGVALEATLDCIELHQRDDIGRGQLGNAVSQVLAIDAARFSVQVSRAFRVLHPLLKVRGDKRVVLDIARLSVEASKAPGRGVEQAKDEAVAAICGIAWVYQRTGQLDLSRVEAERSLALGRDIGWERNTAFCQKCLGRLSRMEAERLLQGSDRAGRLAESERLLREAIDQFQRLGIESEVGDCYSLLARTFMVADRFSDAREATREADMRLVEPGTKDYLDLQIVKGDLQVATNRKVAESIYTDVLKQLTDGDAQKSEIYARAYLQRGRVRTLMREPDAAARDFRRAAEIWAALGDPTADHAHWELERTIAALDKDAMHLLENEPVAIRVRVARLVRERSAGRPATARRSKLTAQYLQGLIREAREHLAVERPAW